MRHFPLRSPLNFNTLLSAKEVRKASVMNHDGQERGRLQCAVSHDGQEHSRLQNAVSHDGQEHMASCAINHGQERTTDHSVQ